jgi:geranylgeranyl diphosphate synthase type II
LVHLTHAHGTPEQQQELARWFSDIPNDDSTKITAVTELFKAAKADTVTLAEVARYTKNAFDVLDRIPLKMAHMQRFKDFGNWLMKRTQ